MAKASLPIELGQTPLTDLRSLGSSTLYHVLIVILASLAVIPVTLPFGESTRPKAIYGEIDPVDNRESVPPSPGEGGGGPGEIGGTSSIPFVSTTGGTKPLEATRDPIADNLLAEILPNPQPMPAEMRQRALPGPQTTGQGLIPGSGAGGGGGVGGGSGTGAGRTIGPGTQFFGAATTLTRLFTLSIAPAAWPPTIHLKLLNVKRLRALTSLLQMPILR